MVPTSSAVIRFRGWDILPLERRLVIRGQQAHVGSRAFDILVALVEHQGRVVTRNKLLDIAWPGLVVEENNLSVQIATLRKVLGSSEISTVPGIGYRLSASPAEQPAPQAKTLTAPKGNLAATRARLFGREDDIAELIPLIRSNRIVTLVGTGGIGKTRLAEAAVHELRDEYPGGAWFVELSPLHDSDLLPAAVAQALGATLPGQKAALDELIDAIGNDPILLLLDNCERFVDATGMFVQELVRRTHGVKVVTTSQERLRQQLEQLFHVGALALPPTNDLADARTSSAVTLLVHRVQALRPHFLLDERNRGDAVEICRRLDGLPLAIELAAASVPLLGLSGVRERLSERFRMLTGGMRTLHPRHRTLHATLEWSHDLLSPQQRAAFRRVGVFVGSFGLKQAQKVLGDASNDQWELLELLGALVDKSLLVTDSGEPPRYRLLESTRAFAQECLDFEGDAAATKRRHADAMIELFEQSLARQWLIPSQTLLIEHLPELDNCRVALEWSAVADHLRHIALAGASAWLFGAVGQSLEGIQHCARALGHVNEDTPIRLEARLLHECCGLAHYSPGQEKRENAERAVELYRQIGDGAALYRALGRFAITASLSGDAPAGAAAVLDMKLLWDKAWPPLARWDLLNAQDFVANMQGRREEGEALAHEQFALATAQQDSSKLLFSLMALEQCAATRGDFWEAVERGRELVSLAKRERYMGKLQVYVANLATSLTMAGEMDEALPVAREAAELDGRHGTLWLSLELFAMVAAKRGRLTEAALVVGRSNAVNSWRNDFREPVEQLLHDTLMALLSASLPRAEIETLFSRGSHLTDEEAARIALAD